jgi:hypothetical protein
MRKFQLKARYALPIFTVLMLASAFATAVPPVAPGAPAASGSANPLHLGFNAGVDGGKGVFLENSFQHTRRGEYIEKTKLRTVDEVLANGKGVSQDERDAITAHWRTSMRLLRILDLAEDDKSKVHIARVGVVMDRVDEKFYTTLKQLNAKAPARTSGVDGGAK